MLLTLTLLDFVLVDRLELEFAPGFSVLTGETGAGKSILLDALQLALGERAEAGMVRPGRARAEVAATFALTPRLAAWLDDHGLDGDDDHCVLRRVLDLGGRSRAYINGRPVTLAQLHEAGEFLVDIHGQHAHYSLLRPGVQRQILDEYAAATDLAGAVADSYRAWRQAEKRCREAETRATEAAAERERLQWRLDELTALDFQGEEWIELLDRHRRLTHAAELLEGARQTVELLEAEGQGGIDLLQAAHARLAELVEIDDSLRSPLEMLDEALVQCREAAHELTRYGERLELDPQALSQAEARLAKVNDVARKYRVRPEALPAELEAARAGLAQLDRLADLEALRHQLDLTRTAYLALAADLGRRRQEAALRLAAAVAQAMQGLAMPGGRFEVTLTPCEAEAGGLESVEFSVAPHAGQGLKPLARTASGGELSRIGLALQTILSQGSGAPILIFDEVDAGIGGAVAQVVGRMLADLSRRHQVLCVTHLPQVAAAATWHFRVGKTLIDGQAVSRVETLDRAGRVEEIARMLGGVKMTETTRRHAEEMLADGLSAR